MRNPDPIAVRPEIVGSTKVGPADLRWEKKAEDLEFEALDKVRAVAEKWGASLAAILGLTATILVVKGREDITELSSHAQVVVGVILALALAAAVGAVLLAAYAAQGTPKKLDWPSGPNLREWQRQAALAAKQKLFWSRLLTLVATLAIAVAVAVVWFGPEGTESGSKVLLTPQRGTPLCRSLVNGDSGLALKVGETVTPLPPGPYSSATAVDGCPKETKQPKGG